MVKPRDVVPRNHSVRAGQVVLQSTLDVFGEAVQTLLVVQVGQLGGIGDVSWHTVCGKIAKGRTSSAFSSVVGPVIGTKVSVRVRERESINSGSRKTPLMLSSPSQQCCLPHTSVGYGMKGFALHVMAVLEGVLVSIQLNRPAKITIVQYYTQESWPILPCPQPLPPSVNPFTHTPIKLKC